MVTVLPIPKDRIRDESVFKVIHLENCKYPVYIEKSLSRLEEIGIIDVAGWSSFRRLVLLEA